MLFGSAEWLEDFHRVINSSAAYAEAAKSWEGDFYFVLEPEGHTLPSLVASDGASSVTVSGYDLNEVRLRAAMAAPGYVVLTDSYYPGWKATLDGEDTPVIRADYLFRAVYAPAGEHEIIFSFRPPDFIWGAIISAVSLILVLSALLILALRLHRRR